MVILFFWSLEQQLKLGPFWGSKNISGLLAEFYLWTWGNKFLLPISSPSEPSHLCCNFYLRFWCGSLTYSGLAYILFYSSLWKMQFLLGTITSCSAVLLVNTLACARLWVQNCQFHHTKYFDLLDKYERES